MKELPAGYRTVFLLHEVEGYEHQEIAEILGCSVGNSKSQLYKARLRFRELLAQPTEPQSAKRNKQPLTRRSTTSKIENWVLPVTPAVQMSEALRGTYLRPRVA
jgi:hypothetical protein